MVDSDPTTFRDIGNFSAWADCAPRLTTVVKECDVNLFNALKTRWWDHHGGGGRKERHGAARGGFLRPCQPLGREGQHIEARLQSVGGQDSEGGTVDPHNTRRIAADRLREGRPVKERLVMLLDARGQLQDPSAGRGGVGYTGEDDWAWHDSKSGDFDVAAV